MAILDTMARDSREASERRRPFFHNADSDVLKKELEKADASRLTLGMF